MDLPVPVRVPVRGAPVPVGMLVDEVDLEQQIALVEHLVGSAVGNGACANCHGDHAQGGSGPMISWTMLTTSQSMGNMPKYVYKTPYEVFATTISGVRPDGSRLNDAMPHYAMTRADFDELVAYLKTL